jgi:hypothetical protein
MAPAVNLDPTIRARLHAVRGQAAAAEMACMR